MCFQAGNRYTMLLGLPSWLEVKKRTDVTLSHSNMSLSSAITERINEIEARPRPLVLCPFRLLSSGLLFVALMLSNLVAVMRWPISALLRVAKSGREQRTGEPIHANDEALAGLINQDLPVIVDFWAEWCGPCLLMNGVLSEFAEAEASRVIVAKVDATLHPRLTKKHKVGGLPTILLFRGGQELGRHVGPMSLGQLRDFAHERSD